MQAVQLPEQRRQLRRCPLAELTSQVRAGTRQPHIGPLVVAGGVEQVQVRVSPDPLAMQIRFLVVVAMRAVNGRIELAFPVSADGGGVVPGLPGDPDNVRNGHSRRLVPAIGVMRGSAVCNRHDKPVIDVAASMRAGNSGRCLRIRGLTTPTLTLTSSDPPEPFTDRLRLAVAAYLARFKGPSREHTESDLRRYLAWCRFKPSSAGRQSPNPYDFALVAMLGLLGLRIFEATGADITDLGEEHGHRVLRVCGKGTKVVPLPPAAGQATGRAAGSISSGPGYSSPHNRHVIIARAELRDR